jgi:hypothetical protein
MDTSAAGLHLPGVVARLIPEGLAGRAPESYTPL